MDLLGSTLIAPGSRHIKAADLLLVVRVNHPCKTVTPLFTVGPGHNESKMSRAQSWFSGTLV